MNTTDIVTIYAMCIISNLDVCIIDPLFLYLYMYEYNNYYTCA